METIISFVDLVPVSEQSWTPAAVTNLVATLGFPIVAAYVMWVFVRTRIEAAERASEKREEASAAREAKMGERIDKLQDDIREELVTVVNKATDVMVETKDCMAQCAGTLAAAATVLSSLTPSEKFQMKKA